VSAGSGGVVRFGLFCMFPVMMAELILHICIYRSRSIHLQPLFDDDSIEKSREPESADSW
jgi:hypothetical protein